MGCFHGYHSRGGAQGVGASTTNAVVSASVLILAFNYIITELFFAIWMMFSSASKISITNLHKAFDDKIVLNGLDLEVNDGESMVIIGASGTGKSVLLKNIIVELTEKDGQYKFKSSRTDKIIETITPETREKLIKLAVDYGITKL